VQHLRSLVAILVAALVSLAAVPPPSRAAEPHSSPHAKGAPHDEPADAPGHGEHGEGSHAHTPHHGFEDAERWAERFDDEERAAWQKPEVVLDALALEPDHVVADIGSATGYFATRIAPRVTKGRVWGVDVEPDMVRYLNERARREGHANLFSILGAPEDPLLPEPVDRVLLVNTYHHVHERTAYFRRLSEGLTTGGRLVIVDYEMGDLPQGPPDTMKIPPAQVRHELEEAGWALERALHGALPYQYVLVFTRA